MKIINRYIFTELIKTFVYALVILTGLMVLVMVAREAVSHHIPPVLALRMIPYLLPEQLRISVPATLLFATTTFFARMSAANEIIALKSLGISPWTIFWPVIMLSFAISLITIWLNEFSLTWGKDKMSQILVAGAEEIIYNNLRTNRSMSASGFSVTVKGVDNKRLTSPTVVIGGKISITAQWAELSTDYTKEEITVSLYNFEGEDLKSGQRFNGKKLTETVDLASLIPGGNAGNRPSEMPMAKIPGEIDKQERDIKTAQDRMATVSVFSVCVGDYNEFAAPIWTQFKDETNSIHQTLNKLRLESPRRISSGFSCFFFVWIGAPLAVWMRKSDIFASFFACFIPILILYYPLLTLGIECGKSGTTPPYLVWLCNIVIGMVGIWFMRQVQRF